MQVKGAPCNTTIIHVASSMNFHTNLGVGVSRSRLSFLGSSHLKETPHSPFCRSPSRCWDVCRLQTSRIVSAEEASCEEEEPTTHNSPAQMSTIYLSTPMLRRVLFLLLASFNRRHHTRITAGLASDSRTREPTRPKAEAATETQADQGQFTQNSSDSEGSGPPAQKLQFQLLIRILGNRK